MGKDFENIKLNIGTAVRDTSDEFATIIGVYVNNRYHEALNSVNWDYVNDDYTISVVAGTQDYDLPSDFGKEIYAIDDTNNTQLKRVEFQDLANMFPGTISEGGTVERYVIFTNDSGTSKIKLHYKPATAFTLALPYHTRPTDLSAATDEPVANLADIIEQGAIADAWKYKKQGLKAQEAELRYKEKLNLLIWNNANQPNMINVFSIAPYSRETV